MVTGGTQSSNSWQDRSSHFIYSMLQKIKNKLNGNTGKAIKIFFVYSLSGIGVFAAGTLLFIHYINKSGETARDFCNQVKTGMDMVELHVLANEKGLEVKHIGKDSDPNEGMIFSTGPNRESKCTVYIKGGQVSGKQYFQFL